MAICATEECEKNVFRRDLCTTHYWRLMRHGDTETVLKPHGRSLKPTCSVEGCDRVASGGRGFCGKHYQRWVNHGDPLITLVELGRTEFERFWPKVNKHGPIPDYRPDLGPCWVWTAAKMEGYGAFWLNGANRHAHRVAYQWLVGAIPEGTEIDHLCRVRACLNPAHLEPVPHWTNVARGVSPHGRNAAKSHCKRGHPFDEQNTRINGNGARVCRTCERAACRASYRQRQAKRAAAAA